MHSDNLRVNAQVRSTFSVKMNNAKKKYLRHVAVGSGSFLCGFDSFYAVPAHFQAFLELTFKSDANPAPTALFIKKVPRLFLFFQSGNFSRVAGTGATLFGWSPSCFFGPALAPTPTYL